MGVFDEVLGGMITARFRNAYGASPLHLLAVIASFLIAAYAFTRIFAAPGPISTMTFFIAAIFAHDALAFPLYSGLNWIANRSIGDRANYWMAERRVQPVNYFRIPTVISAFLFLLYFPLILGLSADRYVKSTGLTTDAFMGRWLGICAALFTISAIAYAIEVGRTARAARLEDEALLGDD
ncbi:MAG: hypothetical protein WBP55_10160 [Solirubrobacterales bacterium]